jgi:hypothetical protein
MKDYTDYQSGRSTCGRPSIEAKRTLPAGAWTKEVQMNRFAIALVAVCLLALVVPAIADDTFYLELVQASRAFDPSWPPDGSAWHELYPVFCTGHTQTGHDDANGNGAIDVCENIMIDGVLSHIDWIGPTFVLRKVGRDQVKYVEATIAKQHDYHEVYPTFCNTVTTDPPIQYVCQEVYVTFPPEDVGWWHVESIETNIITSPSTAVREDTWSRIKAFFENLF